MRDVFGRFVFAVPFGSFVAVAAQFVRFGEDHALGAAANETLVTATEPLDVFRFPPDSERA